MLTSDNLPHVFRAIGLAESMKKSWALRFDGSVVIDHGSVKAPEDYSRFDLFLDLKRAAGMGVRVGLSFNQGRVYQLAVTDPKAGNWTVYASDVPDPASALCKALNKTLLNRLRLQVGLPKL